MAVSMAMSRHFNQNCGGCGKRCRIYAYITREVKNENETINGRMICTACGQDWIFTQTDSWAVSHTWDWGWRKRNKQQAKQMWLQYGEILPDEE